MRNPIRLKNLRWRFLPLYAAAALGIVYTRAGPAGLAAGVVLVLLGEALRTWGAGHLVKNHRLTVTGPYAHVRHPLYAGTFLIASGFALMVGGWVGPALLAALVLWFFLDYFPRKEAVESERLLALYGDEYRVYREAVPALVPRLRPFRPATSGEGRWSGACYDGNNELGTTLALALGVVVLVARNAIGP